MKAIMPWQVIMVGYNNFLATYNIQTIIYLLSQTGYIFSHTGKRVNFKEKFVICKSSG